MKIEWYKAETFEEESLPLLDKLEYEEKVQRGQKANRGLQRGDSIAGQEPAGRPE
jgi:hypothetical protein